MIKTRHKIACAPIAIAAMAALNPTAVLAQDAPTPTAVAPAPSPIVLPAPTPVQSPAPIVLEPQQQAPLKIELPAPKPLVDPPVVAEAQPVATTQTTRRAPAEPQAEEPVATRAAPAPRAEAPVAATAAPAEPVEQSLASATAAETAPMTEAEPVAAASPIANADAATPAPADDPSGAALLLALLGLGGAGLAGFLLLRSRRRRREDAVPVIERPLVAESAPVETPASSGTTDAEFDVPPLRPSSKPPIAPSNGAAVELPSELPASRAERERLYQQMIDAEPDRANPFASHKARAKRARLILQSIGTHFTDRKPGIDLSQYTNVWPELRGWRPATT